MIIDEDSEHTRQLKSLSESQGFETMVILGDPPADSSADVVFINLDLPNLHLDSLMASSALAHAEEIVLMALADEPARVRKAISKGATYFFCKPFDPAFLEQLLKDVYEEITLPLTTSDESNISPLDQFGQLRGSSPAMRKLFRVLRKVAPADASVLLIGESGTGKELVAQTIHQMSAVADGSFIAMNCAGIPKDLFESELFGHEKGSFSGAERQHKGFFERAKGGTLFLDELAEMPIELQAKLLRVLEGGGYRRVGGEKDLQSDVRIVAATNRDPNEAIGQGLLREDLYYRIAQFPIWLPPLRARSDDIQGLAQFFINDLNEKSGTTKAISQAALEALQQYTWPGNVRELRSAIESAFILADGDIEEFHLPQLDESKSSQSLRISVGESIDEAEKKLIYATLEANGGDKQAAAQMLGVSLRTLYNRLNEYEDEDSQPD